MTEYLSASFQGLWTAAAGQWRRLKASIAGVSELSSCEPYIQDIASDLGMSVSELRRVTQGGPGAARELRDRLVVLGFEPRSVDPMVLRDLERVCSQCVAKRRCRSDLEHASASIGDSYCPNSHTLVALTQAAWPSLPGGQSAQ